MRYTVPVSSRKTQKRGSVGRVVEGGSYEILTNTPDAHNKIKGFYDDKHPDRPPMMLNKYGRAVVHDAAIAQEIKDRFGSAKKGGTGEVTVVGPLPDTAGRTRRKLFVVGRVPWKE